MGDSSFNGFEEDRVGYTKLLRNGRSCSALFNGQYFCLLIKSRPL